MPAESNLWTLHGISSGEGNQYVRTEALMACHCAVTFLWEVTLCSAIERTVTIFREEDTRRAKGGD
jgi:hypothetical protein